MPINNPAQNTPSIQPTGVQLPGPKGAVMPNDSRVPANPTPTVDNTRVDDKPIPKSIRGVLLGAKADIKARERILKQKEEDEDNAPHKSTEDNKTYCCGRFR